MTSVTFDMERGIARCRIVLSLVALVAVYVDPTEPLLTRWFPLTSGPFRIDPYARAVLLAHLCYAMAIYLALTFEVATPHRVGRVSTWLDVAFGVVVALVTEGVTSSPFATFFAFAVLTAGLRTGMRAALVVTAISVALYLSLISVSQPTSEMVYLMRPAYLAITGYLVGYLGQQRLTQEARIRELEERAQREHIARSLHDGYAQALAGVSLRLESCRELFRRGQHQDVLAELVELQEGVHREYHELRAYIRSLVDQEVTPATPGRDGDMPISVHAHFSGSARLVAHVLHIMLEGTENVRRHARARSAAIGARTVGQELELTIDDDGVGFPADAPPPWAIASRVAEFGGRLAVQRCSTPGGHLLIRLPGDATWCPPAS